MVKVEIVESLFEEIEAKFKREASKIFDFIESIQENSHKGKIVGNVGGIVIKELKYEKFRFYFLVDEFKLKFADQATLVDILIKFVRMSDKKTQQKTIEEIKRILQIIGSEGFD